MKFQSIVIATGIFGSGWIAAASPDAGVESAIKQPEKSLEGLIADLSAEKFRVREEASKKIWTIGEPALGALQEIAVGKDPEQAYRARELIRKIQLQITPETDPAVVALVERYAKATPNEKLALFGLMYKKRAWRQILKLYATETSPDVQGRLQQTLRRGMSGVEGVGGVAITAARE